jgi:hypothetical protein
MEPIMVERSETRPNVELTGAQRRDGQGRTVTMVRLTRCGPGWPAVAGPVERQVGPATAARGAAMKQRSAPSRPCVRLPGAADQANSDAPPSLTLLADPRAGNAGTKGHG